MIKIRGKTDWVDWTWTWYVTVSTYTRDNVWQESWMDEPDLEYWERRKLDLPGEVDKADLSAEEKQYIKECMDRFFDLQIKQCIDKALDIK